MGENNRADLKLTGGCQCGARRYEATVVSDKAYFCHCRMCRKAVGHVHAAFFMVDAGAVTWFGREPAYFHSSKLAKRGFCPDCGTPLSFQYLDAGHMDLTVGSLDDPSALRLAGHGGVESRVDSFVDPGGLSESKTEDSADYVAKWHAAYGPDSAPGPRA